MSFMDKAKDALAQAKDKAADLAEQHGDKIDKGIGKAGDFVDQKTGGKYADKIDQAQAKARESADRLAAERGAPSATVVGDSTVVAPASVDPLPDPNVVHPVASDPVVADPFGDNPAATSGLRGDLVDDRGPESTRTDPSI